MIIYCDGGSRGNPGPAASAFVVTEDGKTIFKDSKFLGVETNNVAEYTAVLLAIEWLSDKKAKGEIIINLDSQLVERQLNGFWKIKSPKLKLLADEIKSKAVKVKFVWNYRIKNILADDLVNEELDLNGKT